jgi:hypothetical protein
MATVAPPVVSDNGPQGITLEDIQALEALPGQFKKGWKTTEFWQSAIGTLLPVAAFGAALFGYDVDTEVLALSLTGLIPNVAYIGGRSYLKKSRVQGMAQVESQKVAAEAMKQSY